ncbi:MAG: gliding motility protein GldC [Saprospiraceae bacterium]|nr:gliding motility protein GldC [Candidatus Opimibacter iunctus]
MAATTSDINIRIQLDANRVPETIEWQASDAHQTHPSESKSIFLALLDKDSLDTSTMFLWTKELQVAEMDRKIFYALTALTDGYYKSTQNTELANEMRRFVHYFGEKTGILAPEQ